MKTKSLVQVSVFTAVLIVCSWICVPTPIPFTLQLYGVFCAAGLLGAKRSVTAVGLYIALGLFGIPVFAGFQSGVSALFGIRGGFIWGFLLVALVTAAFLKGKKESPKTLMIAMGLGLICDYILGTLWYAAAYLGEISFKTVTAAFGTCVLPFILTDILKLALAVFTVKRLKPLF